MSRIIQELHCIHCGEHIKNIYISFGHPEKGFDWHWECPACGKANTKHIYGEFEILQRKCAKGFCYTIDRWRTKDDKPRIPMTSYDAMSGYKLVLSGMQKRTVYDQSGEKIISKQIQNSKNSKKMKG